jgi:hypothetical protein
MTAHEDKPTSDSAGVHFPAGSLFPDVDRGGQAGVPVVGRGTLPDDDPSAPHLPAAAVGNLATSGRDDQARGDTVTGLGPEAFPDAEEASSADSDED